MPRHWTQGRDENGINWIACTEADTGIALPPIRWADHDRPETFRGLAAKQEGLAAREQERLLRALLRLCVLRYQAEAYRAIAEALAAGQPADVQAIVELSSREAEP